MLMPDSSVLGRDPRWRPEFMLWSVRWLNPLRERYDWRSECGQVSRKLMTGMGIGMVQGSGSGSVKSCKDKKRNFRK